MKSGKNLQLPFCDDGVVEAVEATAPPTSNQIADIAQALGYELEGIDLFRTRLATATRQQLREEVVLLRWPGFN